MSKNNKNDENYIFYIIGQNIKKQRELKGWTQEKLADECDYDLSFIGKLESKTYQTISIPSVNHIAKVLDIHITELFKDLEDEQ
ncbi:MAG: helix-turn-helix transcriptional regulator [Bacilli bacterium]|nr:helix-turn-helix transcriptional regulator [Bacilli bacterium]